MATIEIIELENKDIANGDVCHMNYTVIYKADNVTNVKHNWNTITFEGTFEGQLKSVDSANSACESGQCEQRRLEVGECVIYKDGSQCSVLAAGADDKYTIEQYNYDDKSGEFSADLGSGVIQQYFKPRRTEIPNVSRVKLKTVNHVVKITDAATGKQTLYYTDFLDKTKLDSGNIVSKTVFINLDEQTYLPFWCEPTIGFVAVPDGGNQQVQQLAWTHYMDWCSDLHKFINNPVEACAAYMYTYVKVSPADVAAYCSQNAANINVEQEKILRVLGKMAPSPGNSVPNPPMIVPNPPMIYMRRRLLTNTPLYQIHSPEDPQLYVNAAREVTQSIINNQHFPFVCVNNKNDPQFDALKTQFDALESFDSWTQRKNRVGKKILVLTDDVKPLDNMGFNLSEKKGKYAIYTNSNNLILYVANVFGVEACKNALIQANSWWEDKGFYYVNYGNNYKEFYGIKPFVDSDKICGLYTGIKTGGGDDNDESQTGGVKESNSLCISTQDYKYILFDPTIDNEFDSFEWTKYNPTNKIEYDKFNLSGAVLKSMCEYAHKAILDKYNINNLYETQIAEISPKFTFIFIDKTEESLINIGIKKYIDNILKINKTKLIDNYEDFATNFIIVSPKQIQPDRKKINEDNYMNNFIVYWGYLNIKRMELNKANTGVVFESPLPGSKPFDVPFHKFTGNIAGGAIKKSNASVNAGNCSERLKFDQIEDFKKLRSCIDNIELKDFDGLGQKFSKKEIITVNAINQNAKNNHNSNKKKFYIELYYNITSMVQPIIYKNTESGTDINKKKLYDALLKTKEIRDIKYTINALKIIDVINIIDIIIKAFDTYNISKQINQKPEPEPALPAQSAEPPEDLSQQIHIQITFTVCKLNSPINIKTEAFAPGKDRTIEIKDSTCYHKAYIKSVVPRSADHSECSTIISNAEYIYEATKALYAYKNKGYRLVKLVPDKEHAYFAEHPEGFVKQAMREDMLKVTEYKLGESVPDPLENIIETSELIKDIGYADGLDVAFLASKPDSTDLENMAMLRNGISYAI